MATPVFPIALRGLAALSALSGLLGQATAYNLPEDGQGIEGDPLVSWTLESGLMVALFIAPNREHVVIANMPEHPLFRSVVDLCGDFRIEIDVADDGRRPDGTYRVRRH